MLSNELSPIPASQKPGKVCSIPERSNPFEPKASKFSGIQDMKSLLKQIIYTKLNFLYRKANKVLEVVSSHLVNYTFKSWLKLYRASPFPALISYILSTPIRG